MCCLKVGILQIFYPLTSMHCNYLQAEDEMKLLERCQRDGRRDLATEMLYIERRDRGKTRVQNVTAASGTKFALKIWFQDSLVKCRWIFSINDRRSIL